ncbi:ribose 5-phosphate isomerase [Ferroglobus placidus DSM 10642]|uniref:Ribose-5-phosphate isomerase A n=1 Tax=Ferroglobus placidus (strain DSM 10642 / AEDII12DO) TaxID=589924 RepID=D3S1R9_FERPA|nr:ribose 5-phosphate isomerase A [Ferroglobus placidus]ADC64376.1 ribose 5-phosphate isomerase [Ferroglobus placidus DSM 10642]
MKEIAAEKALEFVENGMILGLGSGSTVRIFVEKLGELVRKERLKVEVIPTSYDTEILAVKNGLKVSSLLEHPEPDLCVDGADQVDRKLNLIKGGGGALTREKIVAEASKKFYVVVDESKLVERLNMAIPVEILPFAYGFVERRLKELGYNCNLRTSVRKLGPVISDNGNYIADVEAKEVDVEKIERDFRVPGIIEHGVFPSEMVDLVIVGRRDGAEIIRK